MRKLSKEYPNDMICYEYRAECTNVFDITYALSFTNIYMKNGVYILRYDHRYRPVNANDEKYIEGLKTSASFDEYIENYCRIA